MNPYRLGVVGLLGVAFASTVLFAVPPPSINRRKIGESSESADAGGANRSAHRRALAGPRHLAGRLRPTMPISSPGVPRPGRQDPESLGSA